MIIELKTFEDMSAAEQRQHLLDILVDGNGDVGPAELEELRKLFLKRVRQPKNAQRAYFTCKELAELVGLSADTIRKMFANEKAGVLKNTTSGRNRKAYRTLRISRAAAKRRFPDLAV
jgi:response regulator of citrate/malate metabolism